MPLTHDIRYALRGFLRNPLFTAVALLSLALGIGANTAIFTLVDQLMLRKLPIRDPDSLVMLFRAGPSHVGNNTGPRTLSFPLYLDLQQRAEPLAEVLCRRETRASVTSGGQTERVGAEMVSANFFEMLGVKPAVGRLFGAEEDDRASGPHPVVVLSYAYWASRFGLDPNVVGSKILVNDHPMTVVGVSAQGFAGLDPARAPQLRLPILMSSAEGFTPGFDVLEDRFTTWVQVFARLEPGYTAESALAPLQVLFQQVHRHEATLPGAREWNGSQREAFLAEKVAVERAAAGYSDLRNRVSAPLAMLMGMVGLVLLIACTNVASLLMAKGFARQKEIAVRLSAGATRARLVGQLLVESLALALLGGAAGIGLALAATRGLLALVPAGWNLLLRPEPDSRILAFTLALCFLTALVFGLAPAIRATRLDLAAALKDGAAPVAGTRGATLLRKALVAAQVSLGFLLLFGAGLFTKSLYELKTADTGFHDLDQLVTFQLDPAANGYDDVRAASLKQTILERLRALPGVESAALACSPLLQEIEFSAGLSVEGRPSLSQEGGPEFLNCFSPGYFETMGIPILEGRGFEARDVKPGYPTVAIVNRRFARHFFGDQSAVGRRLGWGVGPNTPLNIEIVGVVSDSLHQGPREGVKRQVFFPEYGKNAATFYVRAASAPASFLPQVRSLVKELDPSVPVTDLKRLSAQLDETLLTDRLTALLSVSFGLLATLLAMVGLFGLMAFVVTRRTRELGLRMALGARPRVVIWIVMKEVMLLLAIGLAIGVPAALAFGRLVSSQLYGIADSDPWTAFTAMLLMIVASGAAGLVPALRATRIDPTSALRCE